MDIQAPVSSSTCKRGCCFTPFSVCAMSHECHCHRPTPWQEVIEARNRAAAYIATIMNQPDEEPQP